MRRVLRNLWPGMVLGVVGLALASLVWWWRGLDWWPCSMVILGFFSLVLLGIAGASGGHAASPRQQDLFVESMSAPPSMTSQPNTGWNWRIIANGLLVLGLLVVLIAVRVVGG